MPIGVPSPTDPSTVAVSGATVIDMPRPRTTSAGITAVTKRALVVRDGQEKEADRGERGPENQEKARAEPVARSHPPGAKHRISRTSGRSAAPAWDGVYPCPG